MRLPLIKKIFFGLVILSFFSVFVLDRSLSFPYVTSKVLIFRSLIALALPLYLYLIISQRELRPNLKNPLSLAVAGFFLASLAAAVFGVNFGRSFWGNFERMGGVFYLLHLTLLYFYLEMLAKISGIKLQQALKVLAFLGVLSSLYGLLTKFGFPDALYPDGALPFRVSSFFGNPIFFASFLIIPTFLSAFFAFQAESKIKQRLWGAAFLLNLIGIYLSATRGAFLGVLAGFAAGFFVWSLLNNSRKLRLMGLGAIAGALLVFLILIAASKFFPEGSILRRLTDFGDSNTRARIIQWSAGLKGLKENPVLGVGPENYYVIGNKYFNPEIYRYDRSWFDKPHNYPLEVLLTSGILGFLAYLGIILFSLYAGYRALRKGLISPLEFAVLVAAIAAYQIQNMFAFDTMAASISFFAFTGFAGFLWEASQDALPRAAVKIPGAKIIHGFSYGQAALIAISPIVLYGIYLTNYLPAKAVADVNSAVTYGTNEPLKAKEFFDKAFSDPMNFDYNESATKYEEFASEFSLFYQSKEDRPAVIEAVKGALSAMEKAIARVDNDPILWFKLANMRSTLINLTEAPYDEKVEESAKKSVSLAPNRVEPRYFLVQAYQVKKDYQAAIEEQYNIIKIDFGEAFNFWRLSLIYRASGDLFRAYNTAVYARKNGYEFRNVAESIWLSKYYSDLNQFGELVKIYEELIKNNLADFQTYANLATSYAKLGEKEKARAAAYKVLELNPASKAEVEAFLLKLDSGEPF